MDRNHLRDARDLPSLEMIINWPEGRRELSKGGESDATRSRRLFIKTEGKERNAG